MAGFLFHFHLLTGSAGMTYVAIHFPIKDFPYLNQIARFEQLNACFLCVYSTFFELDFEMWIKVIFPCETAVNNTKMWFIWLNGVGAANTGGRSFSYLTRFTVLLPLFYTHERAHKRYQMQSVKWQCIHLCITASNLYTSIYTFKIIINSRAHITAISEKNRPNWHKNVRGKRTIDAVNGFQQS